MREQRFIEQNKEKWKEFEGLMNRKSADPERLGKLFIQITDDLSYARTFYPNRSVRVYLNHLAQQVFHRLYKSRRKSRNPLMHWLVDEVPSAVFHARRELIVSLVIFVLAVGCGVLSGMKNPEFARSILSDQYVEMTERNIEEGDPMAVYKDDNQFYVFAYIAFNNLRIDFYTFVSGLFFGIWTILMLIYNGVMVGSFQFFFAERGLFSESFLTIWMHGALELSAAVIAGGAGLVLGRGIVFPGTYSRLQSLMISARNGLRILMIAVIMTTIAAVIESFLTRYTEIPDGVRFLFIASSFGFVIAYFVVLPWRKYRRGTILPRQGEELLPDLNSRLSVNEIKGVGRMFSDGFVIYQRFFRQYLPVAFVIAGVFTVVHMLVNYESIFTGFHIYAGYMSGPLYPVVWTFTNLGNLFSAGFASGVNLVNFGLTYGCFTAVLYWTDRSLEEDGLVAGPQQKRYGTFPRALLYAFFLAAVANLMFNINGWLTLSVVLLLPVFIAGAAGLYLDDKPAGNVLPVLGESLLRLAGVYLSYLLIGVILFTLVTFPVFSMVFMLGDMLFSIDGVDTNRIFIGLYIFFTAFALLLILPAVISGLMMTYFTGREVVSAAGMSERLRQLRDEQAPKTAYAAME